MKLSSPTTRPLSNTWGILRLQINRSDQNTSRITRGTLDSICHETRDNSFTEVG